MQAFKCFNLDVSPKSVTFALMKLKLLITLLIAMLCIGPVDARKSGKRSSGKRHKTEMTSGRRTSKSSKKSSRRSVKSSSRKGSKKGRRGRRGARALPRSDSRMSLCYPDTVPASPNGNVIIISKADYTLTVVDSIGHPIFSTLCSVGRNYGNKQRQGDKRTPEGTFFICSVEDASDWGKDCHDGRGKRCGVYGPWFLRLGNVPGCTSIGIHGTCFNGTMGSHTSLGCIRLQNEEIERLVPMVGVGTEVVILPEGQHYDNSLPYMVPQLHSPKRAYE